MSIDDSQNQVPSGERYDGDSISDSILESPRRKVSSEVRPDEVASTSLDIPESSLSQGQIRRSPPPDLSNWMVPQQSAWENGTILLGRYLQSSRGMTWRGIPLDISSSMNLGFSSPLDEETIVDSSNTHLGVYQDHLECGLHFLLSDFFVGVMQFYGVIPSLLSPNSIRLLPAIDGLRGLVSSQQYGPDRGPS